MTAISNEVELRDDLSQLLDLDFDFEAACEIAQRRAEVGSGLPLCKGDAAKWVGWREPCCEKSPRCLLLCDPCKRTYQSWMIRGAHVVCGNCGAERGYVTFTPLNRRA